MKQHSDRDLLIDKNILTSRLRQNFFPATNIQNEYGRVNSLSIFNFTRFYKRRKSRAALFALGLAFTILFITVFYNDWIPNTKFHLKQSKIQESHIELVSDLVSSQYVSYDSILRDNFSFNINGSDVMVFLHIQKTGGTTFGKHLVQDIDLESPCICHRKKAKKLSQKKPSKKMLRCECFRPNSVNSNWLFSRYSIGWKCGLHADWTELRECVDEYLNSKEGTRPRRYFYLSILRDPVERFISEFRHVQRGATWKGSTHMCNGRPLSKEDFPPCFDEDKGIWEDVTLTEFMECPTNWAANRQTRMLADLRLVHCYNMSAMSAEDRDAAILKSAKQNLERLAFFGLTELQRETQYMFEETFNMNFRVKFEQLPSTSVDTDLTKEIMEDIAQLNHLDIELYDYAKTLMLQRFEAAKAQDPHFDDHFNFAHPQRSKGFNFNDMDENEEDYDDTKANET